LTAGQDSRGSRLVAFFGERDRSDGGFLVDGAIEALRESGLEQSILVRGTEGFGARHKRQNADILSLSEDLPLVVTAAGDEVEAAGAARALREICGEGLILLEGGSSTTDTDRCRIEIWLRRGRRVGRTPAHRLAVDAARAAGAESAVALLGVDGSNRGNRERARFFSGNAGVPVVVTALMPRGRAASLIARLSGEIPGVAMDTVAAADGGGTGDGLERLTVYGSEALTENSRPLHSEILRAVRREGGAGATALTGIYGFSGTSEARGDVLLQTRRRVPVLTEVVDSAANCARWERSALEHGGPDVRAIRTPIRAIRRTVTR
jgi:PII-like signaling protein